MVLSFELESETEAPPSCEPFKDKHHAHAPCEYVRNHSDFCEGGGYVQWTEIALCSEDATRIVVIVVAILILLYLFLMITSAADEFSDNITLITENHRISQNIAGVTFMAFGNGAPDIFSTIASVLSTKKPKASLAIGELLGGGIFVSTVVVACVILTKPFRFMRRPFLRDTTFYLLALGWLLFMMLHDGQLHLWEPSVYIAFYAVYATVVVAGRYLYQRQRKVHKERRRSERLASRCAHSRRDTQLPPTSRRVTELNAGQLPAIQITDADAVCPTSNGNHFLAPGTLGEPRSRKSSSTGIIPVFLRIPSSRKVSPTNLTAPLPDIVIESIPANNGSSSDSQSASVYPDELTPDDGRHDADDKEPPVVESSDDDESMVYLGGDHNVMSVAEARSRRASVYIRSRGPSTPFIRSRAATALKEIQPDAPRNELVEFLLQFVPTTLEDFKDLSIFSKTMFILRLPFALVLRLTVPNGTNEWNRLLSSLHAVTASITFLGAFHLLTTTPISGGPGLWAYLLPVSAVVAGLIFAFTDRHKEPKYYKHICSYVGFVAAICWIYATASEIVNVVLMLGVMSHVSYEVLGLTVIAWSNSVGDLFTDLSVARQGFPKMAVIAAFGAPLFNLLVGFGVSFFIALLQGKEVKVELNGIRKLMVIFMASSLLLSIVSLSIQRFRARRFHGILLILLYIAFVLVVILAEAKLINP